MDVNELLGRAQRLELKSRYLARSQYAGLYSSAFRGLGMEFADVRPYTEGDEIRLIDWNVSARSQSLYVKRMMEERERNVLLVLDTSGSLSFGSVRRTKFDLLVELAALFILSGFYAKDRVSLALVRSRVETFIPAAKGWTHAARLLREIVVQQPEGGGDEMDQVWSFLNSPGVPRSLVLLLTDFLVPLLPMSAFAAACRKHEVVALLASDPREWDLPPLGRMQIRNPETGEHRVINTSEAALRQEYRSRVQHRRQEMIKMLEGNRVDWVEFSTDADYEAPLRRFLESRIARRGYRRP